MIIHVLCLFYKTYPYIHLIMGAAIIILLLLVGIFYSGRRKDKHKFHPNFIVRHFKLFALLALILIPFIVVNVSFQRPYYSDYGEYLNERLKDTDFKNRSDIYDVLFKMYPDSLPIRLDYIDMVIEEGHPSDHLYDYEFSSNNKINKQSTEYLTAKKLYPGEKYLEDDPDINDISVNDDRFQHYILAVAYENLQISEAARNHYFKEIEINPEYRNSYVKLYNHLFWDKKKLNEFMKNEQFRIHLPLPFQRQYFYHKGMFLSYLWIITVDTFTDVNLFAFIAALIISFIWLYFLRSMDIYRTERWRDMLTVFIGGAAFTNLCWIGYDFARETMHFQLNGNGWNDFLYCTVVIGGSEETVKLLPWLIFAFFTKKLREPYDYILYASTAALGFAFVENWMYLEKPGNILIRSVMSTTGHMFDASVIAYSLILMRFRKHKPYTKWIFPVAGFSLACLSHGFYDFWLISPAAKDFWFLTVIFFILSLHLWFYFKNNAINNSPFYQKGKFDNAVLMDIVLFGIVTALMTEFVLYGLRYGSENANMKMASNGIILLPFLSYMTVIIRNLKIVPGKWSNFKIPVPKFLQKPFELDNLKQGKETDHTGENLRLFVQRSNRYVSPLFPVSGSCNKRITVDGDPYWYLFKLNNKLGYPGFSDDYVVIRVKNASEDLSMDKVEILLFFIPSGTALHLGDLRSGDLRYTGRAFSRPI